MAAVGLAGKFASIYAVVIAAIGAVAGIMISQYLGQDAPAEVRRSFFTNLWLGFGLGRGIHRALPAVPRGDHAGLYGGCADAADGGGYLRLLAGTYLPMAGATMLAAAFRCAGKAAAAAVRGHCVRAFEYGPERPPDLREMRLCRHGRDRRRDRDGPFPVGQFPADAPVLPEDTAASRGGRQAHAAVRGRGRQYLAMLLPLLICEVTWSLGENVYAAIYGRMGHGRQRGHDADRARAGAW